MSLRESNRKYEKDNLQKQTDIQDADEKIKQMECRQRISYQFLMKVIDDKDTMNYQNLSQLPNDKLLNELLSAFEKSNKLNDKNEQIENLQNLNKKRESETSELRKQLKRLNNKLSETQDLNKAKTTEISQLKNRVRVSIHKYNNIENMNNKRKSEIDELKDKIKRMSVKLRQAENRYFDVVANDTLNDTKQSPSNDNMIMDKLIAYDQFLRKLINKNQVIIQPDIFLNLDSHQLN